MKLFNRVYLKFNNFKEISLKDLENADDLTKSLFLIFAGEDKVLQADEAQSL